EPSIGALDDPALALRLESPGFLRAGNDLDRPAAEWCDRIAELWAAVDAIGEDVPQLGESSPQHTEQRHCTVIVLDIGRKYQQGKQEALRIGDYVTLAPINPLAGVEPAWAATFGGFDALTVDDAGRRNSVP